MEGLIVLIALIPIALLILSIILLSKVNGLARDLDLTRKQLAEFVRTATVRPTPSQDAPRAEPAAAPPAPPAPAPPVVVPPPAAPAVPVEAKAPAPPVMDDAVQRMRALFPDADAPKAPPVVHAAPRAPVRPVQPPPRPGFFERHPDLEKFIGENLINKIGIAVLVLGVGYMSSRAAEMHRVPELAEMGMGKLIDAACDVELHEVRKINSLIDLYDKPIIVASDTVLLAYGATPNAAIREMERLGV